jgi:diguanylate cyclase (GGDEF)-like protein
MTRRGSTPAGHGHSAGSDQPDGSPAARLVERVRKWPVWSLRRPALITLLLVETVTLLVVAAAIVDNHRTDSQDWITFGILAAGSMLHLQAVRGIERVRGGVLANTPYVDLKSIWTFAGLLVLPPLPATLLVVLTCVHIRLRLKNVHTFRWLYSSATVLLGTECATVVLFAGLPPGAYPGLPEGWRGVAVIALAAMARWFVNFALVVAIILLSSPKTPAQEALGSLNNNLVEVAALSVGAIAGLCAHYDPWYLVLVLPAVLVLHRSLLLRQYEMAARTDSKTGLANAMHWSEMARAEIARAERDRAAIGILMVDLDHFKRINDDYGHATGDAVLKAVADVLRRESRDYDLVGRFGGEEFMILLPGLVTADLVATAERFRHAIGSMIVISPDNHEPVTVTASAGAVVFPDGGKDLDELLLQADAALYRAKEGGRNRTCFAPRVGEKADLADNAPPAANGKANGSNGHANGSGGGSVKINGVSSEPPVEKAAEDSRPD